VRQVGVLLAAPILGFVLVEPVRAVGQLAEDEAEAVSLSAESAQAGTFAGHDSTDPRDICSALVSSAKMMAAASIVVLGQSTSNGVPSYCAMRRRWSIAAWFTGKASYRFQVRQLGFGHP
jgi:hypothetical protein